MSAAPANASGPSVRRAAHQAVTKTAERLLEHPSERLSPLQGLGEMRVIDPQIVGAEALQHIEVSHGPHLQELNRDSLGFSDSQRVPPGDVAPAAPRRSIGWILIMVVSVVRIKVNDDFAAQEVVAPNGTSSALTVQAVQERSDVEGSRIRHGYCSEPKFRIEAHHAVEASTAALLIQITSGIENIDMPPVSHWNLGLACCAHRTVQQSTCIVAEEFGTRAKLVLKELPKSTRVAYQTTEGRTVHVVSNDLEPSPFVVADELPIEDEALRQVQEGVPLEVPPRVVGGVGYRIA